MPKLTDIFVKEIENILNDAYSITDRKDRHYHIQTKLKKLLEGMNFITWKEYPIAYYPKYRDSIRFGEPRSRKIGLIDIYASDPDITVAIEYDNAASIKWKSIEKLLHSKAQVCFFLAFGPSRDSLLTSTKYYEANMMKIQQVIKEYIKELNQNKEFESLYLLTQRKYWLGILSLNIFKKVGFTEFLSFQPSYKGPLYYKLYGKKRKITKYGAQVILDRLKIRESTSHITLCPHCAFRCIASLKLCPRCGEPLS